MSRPGLTGERIRRLRLDRGIRQAALARDCDISPSYLNLIEHGRRRIGGALLNRISKRLGIEPTALTEGVTAALSTALLDVAGRHPEIDAERERVDDLAQRFPGWSRLLRAEAEEAARLERLVQTLTDRLAHDPFLSASLHDMLSTVTAIRSTAGILRDDEGITPEWRARFHRNIHEESRRLAEVAEALVGYLDAGDAEDRDATAPLDELDGWLEERDWRYPEIEADPDGGAAHVLDDGAALSTAARALLERLVARLAEDAREVPLAALADAAGDAAPDPLALAGAFGVDLSCMFRRLAMLSAAEPDRGAWGYVSADGSGTLLLRRPVPGFGIPRFGAACPLWPLYQSLFRPGQPVRETVTMGEGEPVRFECWAVAAPSWPKGVAGPAVVEASMLILPAAGSEGDALGVGVACRVCARAECPARREPSILAHQL